MLRQRIIPILLLAEGGLVKTRKFTDPVYIGDPINAVKIFNEKEVDELALIDIRATAEGRGPNYQLIREVVAESFMPITYGGGVTSLQHIEDLLKIGVEKVSINTAAYQDRNFIKEAALAFGSSTVVVSIDVKKNFLSRSTVYVKGGKLNTGITPLEYAKEMEALGAGEFLLTSVEREGSMKGFDLALLEEISRNVSIPVICHGGAGSIDHLRQAISSGASAVAAGSLFVFHGKLKGILINYPSQQSLKEQLFS